MDNFSKSFYSFENRIINFQFRDYQENASNKWMDNGYKGIIQMATGLGKTHTAILAIYKLLQDQHLENNGVLILITVPTKYLLFQWKRTLLEFTNLVEIYSPNSQKKMKNISRNLHLLSKNNINHYFLLTTIQSFHRIPEEKYFEVHRNYLLVSDEVQTCGSPKYSNILDEKFDPCWTLGLSATPSRYYDPKGTKFIEKYYGGIIFQMSIKEGQELEYLAHFEYHPVLCELSDEELENYKELTKKMARCGKNEELRKNLATRRSRIIKLALDKMNKFKDLLQSIRNIRKSIIFVEDNSQLNLLTEILGDHFLKFEIFVANTSKSDRDTIIQRLKTNRISSILAIKCFDEGIDIPSLETGFFISHYDNPLQIFQRLGRFLRKSSEKIEPVHIYDFIVYCQEKPRIKAIFTFEENEIKRMNYFKEFADNNIEVDLKINKIFNLKR